MSAIYLARFGLYLDAGLIFGLPAIAWACARQDMLMRWRWLLLSAGLLCFPLSIFGFLVSLAEMADVSLSHLEGDLILALLIGSGLGVAMIARCVASLIYCLCLAKGWSKTAVLMAAIAVASLAWSGHGGSTAGALGYLRVTADILHLLAASAWIGALVLFLLALFDKLGGDATRLAHVGRLLSAFAKPGSIIVATLVITGLSNMVFIAPISGWPHIAHDPYGRAMLGKLVLFLGMLGLAAINRFQLVPILIAGGLTSAKALRVARLTVSIETVAAFAILALVAWLGTLNPLGS